MGWNTLCQKILTFMQLCFHHVWLHRENFACGSHEFKITLSEFLWAHCTEQQPTTRAHPRHHWKTIINAFIISWCPSLSGRRETFVFGKSSLRLRILITHYFNISNDLADHDLIPKSNLTKIRILKLGPIRKESYFFLDVFKNISCCKFFFFRRFLIFALCSQANFFESFQSVIILKNKIIAVDNSALLILFCKFSWICKIIFLVVKFSSLN